MNDEFLFFFSAKRSEQFRTYYHTVLHIIVQPYRNYMLFHTNYRAESISSIINEERYGERHRKAGIDS